MANLKSIEMLLKIKQKHLDDVVLAYANEKRRIISLQAEETDYERKIKDSTRILNSENIAYVRAYAKSLNDLINRIRLDIAKRQNALTEKEVKMQEAFQEVKRLELVIENRQVASQAEEARIEGEEMNEIGMRMWQMSR